MLRRNRNRALPYSIAVYRGEHEPVYFQWWYFDAELENGYHLMMIAMPKLFGIVNDRQNEEEPAITLSILNPAGYIHKRMVFYPGEFQADPKKMSVRFGNNTIYEKDGSYYLDVDLGDGLGCKLTYIPTYSPWQAMPGSDGYTNQIMINLLQRSLNSTKYFHYAAMIPRGKVSGNITYQGETLAIKGSGYHEQGRINFPFQELFKYWYWTRFYIDEWTFIFPVAKASNRVLGAYMRCLLAYKGDELIEDFCDVTGLFLSHKIHSYQSHPLTDLPIPLTATFKGHTPTVRISVEMSLHKEIEGFTFKPFHGAKPNHSSGWFQHLMDVDVKLKWKGESHRLKGAGVFESMLI